MKNVYFCLFVHIAAVAVEHQELLSLAWPKWSFHK